MTVQFTLSGASTSNPDTLTLVSYTAPGSTFVAAPEPAAAADGQGLQAGLMVWVPQFDRAIVAGRGYGAAVRAEGDARNRTGVARKEAANAAMVDHLMQKAAARFGGVLGSEGLHA